MAKHKATKYLSDHWKGNHSLSRSFFINGVLFYILMVAILVAVDRFIHTSNQVIGVLVVVGCGMLWSLGGILCASIKTLKNSDSSLPAKSFALILIALVFGCVIFIIRDLSLLWS